MAYIKKEPIVEFITKGLNNPDKTKAYGYDAIEILTEIEYAPTADVVEVVRCKKCRFSTEGKDWIGRTVYKCCRHNITGLNADDFCSGWERRTDNEERNPKRT